MLGMSGCGRDAFASCRHCVWPPPSCVCVCVRACVRVLVWQDADIFVSAVAIEEALFPYCQTGRALATDKARPGLAQQMLPVTSSSSVCSGHPGSLASELVVVAVLVASWLSRSSLPRGFLTCWAWLFCCFC